MPAAKMFRVHKSWINLAFVLRVEVWPGADWSSEEDEKRPSLWIRFLGNESLQVFEREAVLQGFADIAECEAALVEALEAFNG